MRKGGSIRIEGSLITQTVYCLYCDKCGSFNISKQTSLKVVVVIVFVLITTSLCVLSYGATRQIGGWLANYKKKYFILILINWLAGLSFFPVS